MTLRHFCVVVSALAAVSGLAAEEKSTNPPAPTLVQVLRTNAVGAHTFAPRWVGTSAVVHATGFFQRTEPPVMATNRYKLRFDTVVLTPKSPIGKVGPQGLARGEKDGGYSALHTMRDDLPGDIKLESARTLADLEKLLGPTQGFPAAASEGGETRERVSWSAFALSGNKSLDTLQVNVVVEKRAKKEIHSLEILRGKASPEIKKPEEEKKKKKSEEKTDDEKASDKDKKAEKDEKADEKEEKD